MVSGKDDATLLSRLEERAEGLPIRGIVLVETPGDLPVPCQVRADLIEHSFEHAAPVPLGVR